VVDISFEECRHEDAILKKSGVDTARRYIACERKGSSSVAGSKNVSFDLETYRVLLKELETERSLRQRMEANARIDAMERKKNEKKAQIEGATCMKSVSESLGKNCFLGITESN
jgi:hypothetical protein